MRELSIEECKERQILVLEKIDAFCKAHHLKYVLAFGTLLGAIRHNGYIPWDDDIDIMMPRADYDQFCEQFTSDGAKLLCTETMSDYPYPFAKVIDSNTVLYEMGSNAIELGIYIDVFPMDYRPADEKLHKKFCRKVDFWNRAWLYKSISKDMPCDFKHKLYHWVFRIMTCTTSRREAANKVKKLVEKYSDCNTGIVSCYTFRRGYRWELPFDTYFDSKKHIFEKTEFEIPKQYDLVLKKTYGDYMKLPPENNRTSGHIFKAYEKDSTDQLVKEQTNE